MSYNRTILIGNLTRDPELRYTPNGTAVASFGIAVNSKYKSGEEMKEEVLFMSCVVFGKRADVAAQYISKGSRVLVEGKLVQKRWETEDGQKREKIELTVSDFKFLSSKNSQSSSGAGEQPEEQSELESF